MPQRTAKETAGGASHEAGVEAVWLVHQPVWYDSVSLQERIPCFIAHVHADGSVRLVSEDGKVLKDHADPRRMARRLYRKPPQKMRRANVENHAAPSACDAPHTSPSTMPGHGPPSATPEASQVDMGMNAEKVRQVAKMLEIDEGTTMDLLSAHDWCIERAVEL